MTTKPTIVLQPGLPVELESKDGQAVELKSIHIGAGWEPVTGLAKDPDLDIILVSLVDGKTPKLVSVNPLSAVYYGNMQSASGAISLDGDNRTGQGEGYDENINIDIDRLAPSDGECLALWINIHEAVARNQHFGLIADAFIDVNVPTLDAIKVDLTEDFAGKTSVHVANIYKHNGAWRIKRVCEGFNLTAQTIMDKYNI